MRVHALENAVGHQLCQKLVDYSPVPAALLLKAPQRLSNVVDQCFSLSRQVLRIVPTMPLAFQPAPLARYRMELMELSEASHYQVAFQTYDAGQNRSRTAQNPQHFVTHAIEQTEHYMTSALNPVGDNALTYTIRYARALLRGFLSITTGRSPEDFSQTHLFSLSWAAWLHGLDLVISPDQGSVSLLRFRREALLYPEPQRP